MLKITVISVAGLFRWFGVWACLVSVQAASGQLTWTAYDGNGRRVAEETATFDPGTKAYRMTIPAQQTRVFVTTNFEPVAATPPASGRVLLPVRFSMRATGGFGAAGEVQNKFIAFGLFQTNGTSPAGEGNFADDTGLWLTLYQQAGAAFNSRPSSVRSAAPRCPVDLLGTETKLYGLGTARGGSGGVIVDKQMVDVVMTLVLNADGTWQLGNSTEAVATETTAPGVLFTDRATGGKTLQRTVYSDAASALAGAQTFDEFGFRFDNGTDDTVTLELSALSLVPKNAQVAAAPRPAAAMAVSAMAPLGAGANIDAPLSITLAEPPEVGRKGAVRVYRAADGALVESIDMATLTEKKSKSPRLVPERTYRVATREIGGLEFNYFPIVVIGNTARIQLARRLDYGTAYYVEVDAGVLLDARGAELPAMGAGRSWRFTTKASGPKPGADALLVDDDGPADFSTVQGALDQVTYSPANTKPLAIRVRNGVYEELVHVRAGQNRVTITGESRSGTVIQYLNNSDIFPGKTLYHRGVFLASGDDFRLENLTVKNLTPRYGSQAEAFVTNRDILRCVVSRVTLSSLQDTVMAGGQVFFADSLIEGDVDYMWGGGGCYFLNCELRTLNPGYLTQIRNAEGRPGNVYVGCMLTRGPGLGDATAVLSRINPTGDYAHSQCVFIDCAMDGHIKPTGWKIDGPSGDAPHVRFWEYGSTDLAGAPLDVSQRLTFNAIATGVGSATVLPNQQIDAATAAVLRAPEVTTGFVPAIAPVIEAGPVGGVIEAGGAMVLKVEASRGYPVAAYQWFVNGRVIAGAAGATLEAKVAGTYRVTLTNTAGTVSSAEARVTAR